jgi:hypothetical protein
MSRCSVLDPSGERCSLDDGADAAFASFSRTLVRSIPRKVLVPKSPRSIFIHLPILSNSYDDFIMHWYYYGHSANTIQFDSFEGANSYYKLIQDMFDRIYAKDNNVATLVRGWFL